MFLEAELYAESVALVPKSRINPLDREPV